MSEERQPWDRQPGEPRRWFQRFEAFRMMGPGRSWLAVYKVEWRKRQGISGKGLAEPRRVPGSWDSYAKSANIYARVEAWDNRENKSFSFEAIPVDNRPMKYVYFVKAENGLIKIGIASNVESRLISLQTGSPIEIKLLLCVQTMHAGKIEKQLHETFESKWVRGEWYSLSSEDICKAVIQILEYEK